MCANLRNDPCCSSNEVIPSTDGKIWCLECTKSREHFKTKILDSCLYFTLFYLLDQTCLQKASSLTLFIPNNSEWIASPGPSNTEAKRSKVGLGKEKPGTNTHVSTVNTAVLPSLSDTISLSSSPLYSESNTHPSSESSTLCPLSSSMKST